MALISYGIVGLLCNATDTHPRNFLAFFVGSALAHDLVLVPLVLAIGWLGLRRVPPAVRPALAAALVVAGPVVLYAYPFIRGYGRDAHNPSLLPNQYGWALVTGNRSRRGPPLPSGELGPPATGAPTQRGERVQKPTTHVGEAFGRRRRLYARGMRTVNRQPPGSLRTAMSPSNTSTSPGRSRARARHRRWCQVCAPSPR